MPAPDRDYYARYNARLLDRIPADAALILEIGCAAGELGRRYKWSNHRCRYIGVERDAAAAQAASAHLDLVIEADAQTLAREDIPGLEQGVDCLIYGDVLEHLVDPWALLERHRAWLKPDGQVLACVPNVQYWRVLRGLLRGRFDYAAEGVLDATHLRFFTLSSLIDLFQKAGFAVFEVEPLSDADTGVADDGARAFLQALGPAAAQCGADPAALERQGLAKQYILRAALTPPARSHIFRPTVRTGQTGAGYGPRLYEPLRALTTIAGVRVTDIFPGTGGAGAAVDDARVYLQAGPPLRDEPDVVRLRELLRQDYLLVTECDADPFLDPVHRASDFLALRAAHAVQVPCAALAARVRQLNPTFAIFPDQLAVLPPLPAARCEPAPNAAGATLRVLLLTGFSPIWGAQQAFAWEPLAPVLNAFGRAQAGRFALTVLTFDQTPPDFFLEFLDPAHTRVYAFAKDATLAALLTDADVALFPATLSGDAPWSEYALLVCAAAGVVRLSATQSWSGVVTHEETGLLFEDAASLLAQLTRLADDPALSARLACAAHGRVRERRMLATHYRGRLSWYRHLLRELPRLNKELRRRVPELFDR